MADSNVLSSLGWILDLGNFKAQLATGFVERQDLERIITSEHIDNVLRGCNQLFYWGRRLQTMDNDNVVTLTFMGPSGLIKPDVKKLQERIVQLIGTGRILLINYPENANFVTFLFDSPEAVTAVRQGVSIVDGALACFVDKGYRNQYKIRVLWAPLHYNIEGIEKTLTTWCSRVEIKFEAENFNNGETIPTNKASGLIQLKEGVDLKSLPHIVKLGDTQNRHVLLVIKERLPLCLKCRREGHIRRFCDFVKCAACFLLHSPGSKCPPKSYATAVRTTMEQNINHTSGLDDYGAARREMSSEHPVVCQGGNEVIAEDGSIRDAHKAHEELTKSEAFKTETRDRGSDDFCIVSRRVTRSMKRNGRGILVANRDTNNSAKSFAKGGFEVLEDELESSMNEEREPEVDTSFEEGKKGTDSIEAMKEAMRQSFLKDVSNKVIDQRKERKRLKELVIKQAEIGKKDEERKNIDIKDNDVLKGKLSSTLETVDKPKVVDEIMDMSIDVTGTREPDLLSAEKYEEQDTGLLDEESSNDTDEDALGDEVENSDYPFYLTCAACGAEVFIESEPKEDVSCSGCDIIYFLNPTAKRFEKRMKL